MNERRAPSQGPAVDHPARGRNVRVTVAAVVERDGKFLFVEETIGGNTVLNQPAGHWEAGESLLDATRRETLEEAAWDVEPTALIGVYEYEPPGMGHGFLRFAFAATAVRHYAQRALDPAIHRALWLTPQELRQQSGRHRSPMVQRCVDDFLAGARLPLSAIAHL